MQHIFLEYQVKNTDVADYSENFCLVLSGRQNIKDNLTISNCVFS